MKFSPIVASSLFLTAVSAANSFAASNNYYVSSLPQSERLELLDAMKAAGMKVLRTWVTGHQAGQKGSSNKYVPDVEQNGLRQYDDTLLDQIDQLMVEAHERGIKLLIGMHDKNSLQAGDIYGSKYGDYGFYTNPQAIDDFNQRITHILNGHKNKLIGNRPWSDLGEYIFGLEAQNEPMIFDQTFYKQNLAWVCNTAKQIRNNVGDRNQLIFTGGGSGSASVQDYFFSSSCPDIDVVAIHDYNGDFNSFLGGAISKAQAAGKKLIIEEWGSLYGSGREGNLKYNIDQMNKFKVPWVYWQLITNPDPHQGEDYEIQVNGENWNTIYSYSQQTAALTGAPFDFSASLALSK